MANEAKIVMIGSGCMDEYYEMDFVPKLGEKVCCKALGEKVGGMIGNAAAVAASYGMRTYIMDTVNGGSSARKVLDDFQQAGVLLDLVRVDESLPEVKCLIFLKDGERIVYVIPTAKRELVPDAEQEAILKSADYVYTTLAELRCFARPLEVVDMLHAAGTRLVLDVEYLDEDAKELEWNLLRQADILFINTEGDDHLREKVGPDYRRELTRHSVLVLTEGADGCSVFDSGHDGFHIPAYRVKPVDTTGAGDTFNASFVYGLSCGWTVEEAGRFANAAAARAILGLGARSGAVGEAAVRRFMETGKEK